MDVKYVREKDLEKQIEEKKLLIKQKEEEIKTIKSKIFHLENELELEKVLNASPMNTEEGERIPTMEESIKKYIISEWKYYYKVHLDKIRKLLSVDNEKLRPHQKILAEYLSWYDKKTIALPEYLKWEPVFAKYGLKVDIDIFAHNDKTCAQCGTTHYDLKNRHVRVIQSIDVRYYDTCGNKIIKHIKIDPNIEQTDVFEVELICKDEVWNEEIKRIRREIHKLNENMNIEDFTKTLYSYASKLKWLVDKDNKVIRTKEKKTMLCEKCFAEPDFSKIEFASEYDWVKKYDNAIIIRKKEGN